MFTVYVLKSKKDGNLYVGCTSNLQKRLAEHSSGRVFSTKHRLPFELVFTEEFSDKYHAYNIEKYYKTAKGKRELKIKLALSSNS